MNHQRISRRAVAIARVCSLEVLHDNETSQQRADRLLVPHKRRNGIVNLIDRRAEGGASQRFEIRPLCLSSRTKSQRLARAKRRQ